MLNEQRTPASTDSTSCANCRRLLCSVLPGRSLRSLHRIHLLSRGDRLVSAEDANCLKFWIVLSGTAATCTAFEDGRRQIVSIETPGETLCGLMAGPGTQNWLEALSDVRICEIDLSTQARDLQGNPAFLAATFHVAHRRLERMQAHVTTLGRLDSVERVTLFLAEMAVRAGANQESLQLVTLPMSREDIADYLGLNAETVSRILTKLKKAKLVKFLSPSEYVIPDLARVAGRLPVNIPDPSVFRPDLVPSGPSTLHEVPA